VYPIATTIGNVTETMIEILDASITVTKIWSSTKIQGRITSTTDFVTMPISSITQGNIKVNNVWANSKPTAIDFISSGVSPFDLTFFDNVEYDEDGVPQLGTNAVDTIIRSNYTDTSLGLRPEDINVDGGAYVDKYSSHAPEELVPGIVFDTLDMKVYTLIELEANINAILGYRIFSDMVSDTSYSRIAESATTTLSSALNITDEVINLVDASVLPIPSPINGIPGVVFIGSERITYYTIDLDNNQIGQLRRGTKGTAAPLVHNAGAAVIDASLEQSIPGTVEGNVTLTEDTTYTSTLTPTYNLRLDSNISANVGDVIAQTVSGSSVTVVGISDTDTNIVLVNGAVNFVFPDISIYLGSNVTVSIGDTVTESTTGAVLTVTEAVTNANVIFARYNSLELLSTVGNVQINGGANISLTASLINTSVEQALLINDVALPIYPISQVLRGKVDSTGSVTINANVTLHTDNVWYELGAFSAANGVGFENTNTEPVLFLKAGPASFTTRIPSIPNPITTEDAVNIITEDGNDLYEEN
jgi:hypothetical protein